ncbi:uridine kinase [Streptomyces sp. NPDC058374]|uniref:uridine kinase family protein n=1 Tax=Streptomyces sp. NPDC058374 TaxID=3346466 RepID=UPI0036609F31
MRQDPADQPGPTGPLPRLAAEVRAAPPSLGPVRLVAVDGYAGSGKTTFAGRLAEALDGAPVLHLDDLATHEEPFAWTVRLREQVLAPLAKGEDAHYRPYDWHRRAFGAPRPLPAAPVVLVEGVGAGRRAVRPVLARLLWMDVPARTARLRGEERDGPELAAFWRGWVRAERLHFTSDASRPFADTLVRHGTTEPALLSGPGRDGANAALGDGR